MPVPSDIYEEERIEAVSDRICREWTGNGLKPVSAGCRYMEGGLNLNGWIH